MNIPSLLTIRSLCALLALSATPLGFSQISDAQIDSIFARLNGDDFTARYAARIELQDEVAKASAPGNKSEQSLVEAQLLEKLASEELLTTKLWILRQIEIIGSPASLPALRALLDSDSDHLANGAQMAIDRIDPPVTPVTSVLPAKASAEDLAELARNDANRAVRAAAFSKLIDKNSKLALAILEEENAAKPEFLRSAMLSKKTSLKKALVKGLANDSVADQIVVIGTMKGGPSSQGEKVLLGLLGSENETLEIQVLEALGRIGSVKSLDALLQGIESRNRDIKDTAADSLAAISDRRIDAKLYQAAKSGEVDSRIQAVSALSLRASPGVNELVNAYAADSTLDAKLREEAIDAMQLVGDVDSLPILVQIIIDDGDSGLSKDAQRTLKRMSLRLADPDAAWSAFADGFAKTDSDIDARLALMLVSDSAPNEEMIKFLESEWATGNERIQKMVLRVLPTWRNWDGGFALIDLAESAGDDADLREQCFKGIGKLILGSDATFPISVKFDLTALALEKAKSPEERQAVISGFRYSTWRERVHVTYNDVDPELKEAVLEYAKD